MYGGKVGGREVGRVGGGEKEGLELTFVKEGVV